MDQVRENTLRQIMRDMGRVLVAYSGDRVWDGRWLKSAAFRRSCKAAGCAAARV